jgi:hypothetical protein
MVSRFEPSDPPSLDPVRDSKRKKTIEEVVTNNNTQKVRWHNLVGSFEDHRQA